MPEMPVPEMYVIEDLWTARTYRVRLWALCRGCGRVKEFAAYDLIKRSRDTDRKLYEIARPAQDHPGPRHRRSRQAHRAAAEIGARLVMAHLMWAIQMRSAHFLQNSLRHLDGPHSRAMTARGNLPIEY
jgi:hypothetical protein